MQRPIYFDNNATTPMDPKVLDAMLPYFKEEFGNSASRNHAFGWAAEEATEIARKQIADLIGANPKEIVFTSGATESDNLAVKGVAEMYREKGNHIITCVTEHKAIIDPCKYLETQGYQVTWLEVDKHGNINLDELEKAITNKTILISIMAANNESGVVHPIAKIGEIAKRHDVIFHTDATQAVGKISLDVEAMKVDLLSMSGHKIYGPKGVGALFVRRKNPRVKLSPIIHGGGHERGMRSGTLNVPGIVGLGRACELCMNSLKDGGIEKIRALRNRLYEKIKSQLDFIEVNGDLDKGLPGTLNISFSFVEGEALMMGMKDVAVSSGSACTSASLEPSYVLRAMGVGDDLAHSSIRFSVGRFNTSEEVDKVADYVVRSVKKLREMSPLYEMAQEGIDIKTVKWAQASH